MNKNKIKKSANFVFWLGLSPILLFVTTTLFIIGFTIFHHNRQVGSVDTPEVIHDTVYVECPKKHCDDLVITPVKKKVTKQKQTDTVPQSIPEEMETIDATEKSEK